MSLNSRYKMVLRPEFPNIDGVRTLNGLPEQPFVDNSGNIDMSGNFLLVKNIEAGIEDFTTHGEKGIVNIFSDSTDVGVSCINFSHVIDENINNDGNSRRYCSFNAKNTGDQIDKTFIVGSITGNQCQVSYNTISDKNVKSDINYIYNYTNGSLIYPSWLESVNALNPCTFSFNPYYVGENNTNFKYTNSVNEEISVKYQGFLAHEVQDVYPPAVYDISAAEINGMPFFQQLDMTKLIPMMVGAIKELTSKVQTLEGNYTTQATEIGNIQTDVQTLDNNYTTLEGNYTTLEDNYTTQATEIGKIQTDVQTIQTNYTTQATEIGKIQTDVQTIQTNYTTLQTIVYEQHPDANPILK